MLFALSVLIASRPTISNLEARVEALAEKVHSLQMEKMEDVFGASVDEDFFLKIRSDAGDIEGFEV